MNLRSLLSMARLCLNPNGRARINPSWLLRRVSRIHADYVASAQVTVAEDGEFQKVTVNGRPYVWPRSAPVEELLRIVAELELVDHPHQYLWGPTNVKAGDVVLDVGACEGGFSALVAERGAVPIAIEPSRPMHRVIQRLFEVRGLAQPRIVADALSDAPGSGFFVDDGVDVLSSHLGNAEDRADSAARPGYAVRVRTLDDLVEELALPRVDFIKCDAEGADVRILRGATRTLERWRPRIVFCIYHQHSHFKEMREILKPLGYRVKGKGIINQGHRVVGVLLHGW
jgi:FkbM family methyltransferase